MHEKYRNKQPIFYNVVDKIISNNKISHAYLLDVNGVSFYKEIVFEIVNKFLFLGVDNSKLEQYNILLNNGSYPDLKIIDLNSKVIKKEEILKLEEEFLVKPLLGKYKVYIIFNCENLNDSSANTILKFLEEPQENIIAFLVTNNVNDVINTIISRCQVFSLIPDNKDYLLPLFDSYSDYEDFLESKKNEYLDTIKYIEENQLDCIGIKDTYFFKDSLKLLLNMWLIYYLDLLFYKMNLDEKVLMFEKNDFLNYDKIDNNEIINRVDVINKYISLVDLNVNRDLFIDNLIIDLYGGNND